MTGFAYYVIQRNDTINDSIFHRSNGMQGAYSKMLGVVRILFLVCWVLDFDPQTLSCGQVATHLTTALPCMCVGTVKGSCAMLNGHPSWTYRISFTWLCGWRTWRFSLTFSFACPVSTNVLVVVVVYHVTIVATGHGLLKKFWPLVLGCVLRRE